MSTAIPQVVGDLGAGLLSTPLLVAAVVPTIPCQFHTPETAAETC